MDKNTLLAVVLSVIVLTIGFSIQTFFTQQREAVAEQTAIENNDTGVSAIDTQNASSGGTNGSVSSISNDASAGSANGQQAATVATVSDIADTTTELVEAEPVIETDLFKATFSTKGAKMVSLKLKQYQDDGEQLEMINRSGSDEGAFQIRFGGPERKPVDDLFAYDISGSGNPGKGAQKITFTRNFATVDPDGNKIPFTLRKVFTFQPDDYMIQVEIEIENSVKEYLNLNTDGYSYTLGFGPQIGPKFEKLDNRYNFRKYVVFRDDKKKELHIPKSGLLEFDQQVDWAAISGKYFAVAAIPDAAKYTLSFSNSALPGLDEPSQMLFSRPLIKSSKNSDMFRFYIGPKLARNLGVYDDPAKNIFGYKDMQLGKLMEIGGLFGWLEAILKKILELFYLMIHNYGVAIILLTVVVKIALFPFTHKSFESTRKMQTLSPKIEELKAKYADNPNRMNSEMAELYKKEGINPLQGCLPLLLQMPIFIALYGLLNKHFDLRGAMFIPGWITDLSAPESIYTMSFSLPFIQDHIRLLPILFVITQIIYSKFMGSTNTAANNQMKMMTYMMPIVFFFILYNAPSGLILYWTVSNILTGVQQYYINHFSKKKV